LRAETTTGFRHRRGTELDHPAEVAKSQRQAEVTVASVPPSRDIIGSGLEMQKVSAANHRAETAHRLGITREGLYK
jgi:hypothetical protein